MKSPIQSLVELVKDRDLRQKANKDTMSGTAPLKVPATFISCRKCGRRALHSRWEENYYISLIAVLTVLSEPIIA